MTPSGDEFDADDFELIEKDDVLYFSCADDGAQGAAAGAEGFPAAAAAEPPLAAAPEPVVAAPAAQSGNVFDIFSLDDSVAAAAMVRVTENFR